MTKCYVCGQEVKEYQSNGVDPHGAYHFECKFTSNNEKEEVLTMLETAENLLGTVKDMLEKIKEKI